MDGILHGRKSIEMLPLLRINVVLFLLLLFVTVCSSITFYSFSIIPKTTAIKIEIYKFFQVQ